MSRRNNRIGTIGEVLKRPDFTSVEGFRDRVSRLPYQERVQAELNGVPIPNAYWLVDQGTTNVNAMISDRYEIVQDEEVFDGIAQGVETLGLPVSGHFVTKPSRYGAPNGSVSAFMLFESPDFRKRIGRGDEHLAVGLRVDHGHDGRTGLVLRGFGLNLVCSNGMVDDALLGVRRVKHIGNVSEQVQAMQSFTHELLVRATQLPGIFEEAERRAVKDREIEPLVASVGIAPRHAKRIAEGFDQYLVGEQAAMGVNVKSVFNAATYYGTHVYDRTFQSAEQLLENASKLLSITDLDDAIKAGERKLKPRKVAAVPTPPPKPTHIPAPPPKPIARSAM